MLKHFATQAVTLLLLIGTFAPWATILLSPHYAFAQTGPSAPANSAAGNQAQRQGGNLSLSQGAAAGVTSLAGCLAAAGLTIGGGLAYLAGLLGLTTAATAVSGAATVPAAGLSVPVIDYQRVAADAAAAAQRLVQINIESSLLTKEVIFDCIAWAIAKAIWKAIAASVIDWINSGFNGRPAFIQNLGRFMTGIADQIAGDIIMNSPFAFLCSPFSLSIRIALARTYARRTAPACTLTQVMQNIRGFLNNFSQGGWPSWLQLIEENNNPYGAYVVGQATINLNIMTAQGRLGTQLNWSGGFLSKTEYSCTLDPTGGGTTCKTLIVTPGELIAKQAGEVIGQGNTTLLLADELNEIISALVSMLLQKALESFSALSSSSSFQDDYYRYSSYSGDISGGGSGSFTGALGAEGAQVNGSGTAVGADQISAEIAQGIQTEQQYQQLNQTAIANIQTAQTAQTQVAACWNAKATGGALTPAQVQTAQSQAQTATAAATALGAQTAQFQANTTNTAANITALQALAAQATAAPSQGDLANILYEYYALIATPAFATQTEIQSLTTTVATLQTTLAVQNSTAQTALASCNAFPN